MISWLIAALVGDGYPYRLTVGANGTPFFFRGFYDVGGLGVGSTDPVSIDVNGEELLAAYSATSGFDFAIVLDDTDANGAQTDFTGIIIEDGDGVFRTYLTAAATFALGSGIATWTWGTGTDFVYDINDNTETKMFKILN